MLATMWFKIDSDTGKGLVTKTTLLCQITLAIKSQLVMDQITDIQ